MSQCCLLSKSSWEENLNVSKSLYAMLIYDSLWSSSQVLLMHKLQVSDNCGYYSGQL